jgi:hypothetical protein
MLNGKWKLHDLRAHNFSYPMGYTAQRHAEFASPELSVPEQHDLRSSSIASLRWSSRELAILFQRRVLDPLFLSKMLADPEPIKCANENCPHLVPPSTKSTKGPQRKFCSPECRKSAENRRQKLKKRVLRSAGFEPGKLDPEEQKKVQERRLRNYLNPLYFN